MFTATETEMGRFDMMFGQQEIVMTKGENAVVSILLRTNRVLDAVRSIFNYPCTSFSVLLFLIHCLSQ